MANDDSKPINKKEMIEVMIGFSESILNGVQTMFDKHEESNNKRFDSIENRLDKLETDVSEVKDEIKGIKSDLSTTVTKKEFNELKTKVDQYTATN